MKTIKPRTLEEFLEIFNNIEYNKNDCYYRGQSEAKWDIIPSIARNRKIFNYIEEIEAKLISKFLEKIKEYDLNYLIPLLKNTIDESWQILMIAQHYGLPTRFLDFTNNKLVALDFAITDFHHLKKDSALIIYCNSDNNQKNDDVFFKRPFIALEESFFLNARIALKAEGNEKRLSEIRKLIQGSKFLYRGNKNLFCCLSLDNTHSQNLVKIVISNTIKPAIIKHFVKEKQILFDPFRGKNGIDYLSTILKNEFLKLDESAIDNYL